MSENRELEVRAYTLWDLFLHPNQSSKLGRCYAQPREDLRSFSKMAFREISELFDEVVPGWERAVDELWKPSSKSLVIRGDPHSRLKVHLIPKYQTRRELEPNRDSRPILLQIRDLISYKLADYRNAWEG